MDLKNNLSIKRIRVFENSLLIFQKIILKPFLRPIKFSLTMQHHFNYLAKLKLLAIYFYETLFSKRDKTWFYYQKS
ncbi:unnamed protein product [Blepharisma stoltei]|uniref:Uncharacterized protein n=1 Tax=Blepharisma stoltei TaxID=1481888 RepID=A0AAU9ILX8_9CILI|nr:unnamed protein product [Blepharisma stoltei]